MTRKKSTPSIEALDQVFTSVDRVTGTIRRVLVKYPENTLPAPLLPFVRRLWPVSVRRSGKGDEIVIVVTSIFNSQTIVRFPVTLLDAQESEITRWARDQYWSGIRAAKFREKQNAEANLAKAKRAVDKAQAELTAAQGQLTRATSVVMGKNPVRRKSMNP
ncbi:hypothetical protein [Arthrobacter sp. AD-310]